MDTIPDKLLQLFKEQNVPYEVIVHPEAYTAQELAAVEHVKGRYHAKVVMVNNDGEMLMTVIPGDRWVDLEKLEDLTGKSAALASEEEFKTLFPDCDVGAMPPFGNLYGVPVLIDKNLCKDEFIVFQAGTHNQSLKMDFKDYERMVRPRVAGFAVK